MCLTLSMVCTIGIIVPLLALIQLQYVKLNWKDRLRRWLNENRAFVAFFEYFPVYNFVRYTWSSYQHNQFSFEYFTYDGCGLIEKPLRICIHPLGISGYLLKLKLIASFCSTFFSLFFFSSHLCQLQKARECERKRKKRAKNGKSGNFPWRKKKRWTKCSAENGIDRLNRVPWNVCI